jgi:hypothetical protein
MRRYFQTFLVGGTTLFPLLSTNPVLAQQPSPQYPAPHPSPGERRIDPATGIEYERQVRTIETPVVKSQLESKTVTISRPEVVTETVPVTSNYWTPVVRHEWQPYWRGLWNPFTPATLEYRYVPQTRWEQRSDTFHQVKTATRWVSEQKVIQEPRLVTSIEKRQVEDWVAVSRPLDSRLANQAPANRAPSTNLQPIPSSPGNGQLAPLPQATTTRTAGLPPTVLDPYSTRPAYGSWSNGGTIFR